MKHMHALGLRLLFACALVFFVAGCGEGQDGSAEKAGKAIDETIQKGTDSVNEATENAGEAMSDTLESAEDAVKDATDSAGEAMNDAATKAGDAATEAAAVKE
jgi:uncharacterized lipoprotein YehR (DUF1307 family)